MRVLAALLLYCTATSAAESQRTVGLSFSALKAVDDDGFRGGPTFFWMLDSQTFLLDIAFTFHVGEEGSGDGSAGVGGYLPFGEGDVAFYVGGGLRYGFQVPRHMQPGHGIEPFVAAGVLSGRSGSVKLRFQAELFYDTFRTQEYDYDTASYPCSACVAPSEPERHDHQYGVVLSLGLGF